MVFAVLTMTTPALIPGTCPSEDWKEFGQYCYYFSNNSERYNYEESEHLCQTKGGNYFEAHLASIHSTAEHQFIWDIGNTEYDTHTKWIGLRKADNSKKVMSFQNKQCMYRVGIVNLFLNITHCFMAHMINIWKTTSKYCELL